MAHVFNEEHLVERPAIELFGALGWTTISAMEETFGPSGTLGREMKGEAVLERHLRAALTRLNPTLPPGAVDHAVDELSRDRSAMSIEAANRELYALLKDGVPVMVTDPQRGSQRPERVRVIDWDKPGSNDFLLVSQLTLTGPFYTCRPDLIGFVNGLPLVVIELKKPGVAAKQAFDDNLTSYKHLQNGIPQLFWFNALMIASNGTDSRVGSITADWERYAEWKRVEREDEPRRVSLEVVIRGTCDKGRLLDIVENFTLFSEHKSGTVKVLAQNHQYLGVNNAIRASMAARARGSGQGGVFWQTQGSGKSFSMVFYAQKVLRKVPGDWTFVVITDRVELDDQIAKTFAACGVVADADSGHATSGAHLRELLRGNNPFVFTLIQKFSSSEVLSDRRDIIVLTDEAHRSQYDTLALNMRAALPNALFLAFTGTPLIAGEERTREVFGDYVSIYDFQQSVEDGATVPLFYENRTPELQLNNPDLNDDIYGVIEDADLDEAGEKKLERELGRQYQLITRDERLDTVARDIVQHFLGRGFQGKAMVVSIDKPTALRMYDKVRRYWADERQSVEDEIRALEAAPAGAAGTEALQELRVRLGVLVTTDMAVVVSGEQNEVERMKALGLDILRHRKRMLDEDLPEKFKAPGDPFRLVFVCAMWLTGFDAPSCSTIYLDKPMRNHTLMQAIARANRVYPGKQSGLIVDYANVFASLEKALAIYGKGTGGETPVRDKRELVEELRKALAEAVEYCARWAVSVDAIAALPAGGLDRLSRLSAAVEAMISPDHIRKPFLAHERLVAALYRAIKPDPAVVEFAGRVACLTSIADSIRQQTEGEPPDIKAVLGRIGDLLDESIVPGGYAIRPEGSAVIDISKIDFGALAAKLKASKSQKLELEQLKAAIKAQLDRLVRFNPTRADYAEKFEALIDSYNAGSRSIDDLFRQLLELTQTLTVEQERHVRESLSEEELTVFDVLTRPGPDLTPAEREEVKKVARHLLTRLRELLVIEWRDKSQTRARVQTEIQDLLDAELPRAYDKPLYEAKCRALYEHVYERYYGDGRSAFAIGSAGRDSN